MEKLINRRIQRLGRYREEVVVEYLVQWAGYRPEWNQWVSENDISDDLIRAYKQSMGESLTEEGPGEE